MSRKRNPQYDVRDAKFKSFCERCYRARRCSFKDSPQGPEQVCNELVMGRKLDCEVCLRQKGSKCNFTCCFFKEKKYQ